MRRFQNDGPVQFVQNTRRTETIVLRGPGKAGVVELLLHADVLLSDVSEYYSVLILHSGTSVFRSGLFHKDLLNSYCCLVLPVFFQATAGAVLCNS